MASYSRSDGAGGDTSVSTTGMFSYPSSPLFEQPFVNRDFYAEQTPLRSRNTGVSGNGDTPYFSTNAYLASPDTKRRKSFANYYNQHYYSQHGPDRWVKQVMRLVLLSPLIVLIMWSVGAVLFTSGRRTSLYPKSQALLMQQAKARGPSNNNRAEMFKEGLLEVVEVSSELFGQPQPQLTQPMQQVQQPLLGGTGQLMQVQPQGFSEYHAALHASHPQVTPILASHQESQMQPLQQTVQQMQLLGSVQQAQPLQSVQQVAQPMGQTMQQLEPFQRRQPDSYEHNSNNNVISIFNPSGAIDPDHKTKPRGWVHNLLHQESPAKKLSRNVIVQPQHLHGSKNVAYYYYDPRSTSQGPNGQVYLPRVIYDQAGNALDINKVMTNPNGQATQVFIQPPLPFGSNSGTPTTNSNVSPDQSQQLLPVQDPIKGISMPENLKNVVHDAEVRYQQNGSSVIVATVAVMALLVGALSARRLRGRASVLSACIENERLDHAVDDAATDTGTAATYSTFHWKGDLEKFDV